MFDCKFLRFRTYSILFISLWSTNLYKIQKESWIKNGTECYQAENYASCVLLYAIYLFRWIRDSNSGDLSQIHLEGGKKRKIMTCIFAKKSQNLTFVQIFRWWSYILENSQMNFIVNCKLNSNFESIFLFLTIATFLSQQLANFCKL